MENETTMGQVIPFARSAEYLRRLAVKQRTRGKPVQALELLRLSLKKAPNDAGVVMELAETYAEMQCPSLSNRALFSLLKDESVAPECLYGAGCNFYAIQMPDCARDCLVLYLQKRPDGEFAPEAVDLIETIDGTAEEGSPLEARITRRMSRALDSMDEDRPHLAARQIRRVLSLERHNGGAHALLAFALLGANDTAGALEAARFAMRCSREDIRALCAMAAALKANGSHDAARLFLNRAVSRIENDEDTQLVCQTACEMGDHACVRKVLSKLMPESPLNDELLHLFASACQNAGDTEEAMRCWRLLRRIDPMDTVAEYRLARAEDGTLLREIPYARQAPLAETLARLSLLRGWVQEGADALLARWADGDEVEKLLRWGLSSTEHGVPQAMMGVLTTIGDARAQAALRDMLCDAGIADALKHSALAALCLMGVKGPFYALISGRLTIVHVSRAESTQADPHLNALLLSVKRRMGPLTGDEEARALSLCRAAAEMPGVHGASFRVRAVELALRRLRGEAVKMSAKPAQRRRLERSVRRILKEADHGVR